MERERERWTEGRNEGEKYFNLMSFELSLVFTTA